MPLRMPMAPTKTKMRTSWARKRCQTKLLLLLPLLPPAPEAGKGRLPPSQRPQPLHVEMATRNRRLACVYHPFAR